MYVVGQYPRFLRAHWKFLKTVINKLFEFMHETHEGVQDMACDTFIKIVQKCKRHFVTIQPGESMPFVEELFQCLPVTIADLSPSQVHTFYEAVGHMISAQPSRLVQERWILELMDGPNAAWDSIMAAANQNADILNAPDQVKQLANIMKTNVAACSSIGGPFIVQVARIYMDMLSLYKATSELISRAVVEGGVFTWALIDIRHKINFIDRINSNENPESPRIANG
jgi:exportin-1